MLSERQSAIALESNSAWQSQLGVLGWTIVQSRWPPVASGEVVAEHPGIRITVHGEAPQCFEVEFPGSALFAIDFGTRVVECGLSPEIDEDYLAHLLGDQIVPRILAQLGTLIAHGAAVRLDEGTFLLVGPSGCGKSTLAASFHAAGADLLGDDAIKIFQVGGQWMAEAVYRSLRLYPDSLESTFDDHLSWRSVSPSSTKRQAPALGNEPIAPTPIDAIIFINPEQPAPTAIQELNRVQACCGLVENGFWLDICEPGQLKMRLAAAAAVVANVPSLMLSFSRLFSSLPEVRSLIVNRIKEIRQ